MEHTLCLVWNRIFGCYGLEGSGKCDCCCRQRRARGCRLGRHLVMGLGSVIRVAFGDRVGTPRTRRFRCYFFGVWEGYNIARSDWGKYRWFDLSIRSYRVWSGGYDDFGRFCAADEDGGMRPQDIAWPSSRSWFYHIDTDWTSALIGGSRATIHELVRTSTVEVLEINSRSSSSVLQQLAGPG